MATTKAGETPDAVVVRYLGGLVAHDWPAVSDCLADDVVRVGPFGDVYEGRQDYLSFLSGLMPSLPGYAMRVDRVLPTDASGDSLDGSATVLVELTETVELDGDPVDTAEALVLDLDPQVRIAHIAIYIQRT